MNREDILNAAIVATADREEDYGGINNLDEAARMISVYLNKDISAHDVSIIQIILKLIRIKYSPEKADHWIDIAGYSALGSEARDKSVEEVLEESEDSEGLFV